MPETFDAPQLLAQLLSATDESLDQLSFGVIAIDAQGRVTRYNRYESQLSGLSPERVKGKHLFTGVAPCMNNPLISGLIREAREAGDALDETIDYVLAFRIRPVAVKLRMLCEPGVDGCYLVIRRADEAA
ncbi:MAG: PAS domain-containing protein [Burkholderiaceae bacterium]|nr:PAS domain-containing protein [Burkholderiaceae bacterium]